MLRQAYVFFSSRRRHTRLQRDWSSDVCSSDLFKDIFATRPDIKIVETVDIKGDVRDAFDKTQELIAQTSAKKIDAFVCLDSASGKMVSDAVKRTNTKDRL